MTGSDAGDGSFLERWSRRKLGGAPQEADQRTEPPALTGAEADASCSAEPDPATEEEEAALLERLGLKNPDTLVKGDDFAAFMRTGVPRGIRRRALRRLWVSDPVLANLDKLVDHGEDYTDAATVIVGMKTSYQVGRGMLRALMADEPAKAAADEMAQADVALGLPAVGNPDAAAVVDVSPARAADADSHSDAADEQARPAVAVAPAITPLADADAPATPTTRELAPRRASMRFTFEA